MTARRGFRPINFVFGIVMGTADVIPGISGGTMALILGFYQRLIASIRAASIGITEFARGRRGSARVAVGEIEWGLILPLGVGVVCALVLGARLIEPLMEAYPVQLRAFFFGLITASIAIPWRAIERPSGGILALAVIGAILGFLFAGLPPREVVDPPLIAVFFSAMIAICAMLLPGVSGAFLLFVMGMYGPSLDALNARDFTYVAVFALGALIGLGAFSKVLYYLLNRHHDVTLALLVGLMAGSLRALWPYQDEARALLPPSSTGSSLSSLALAAIGFAIVTLLTRLGDASGSSSMRPIHSAERR